MKKKYLKKGLAGLLVIVMAFGMLPPYGSAVTVIAQNGTAVTRSSNTAQAAMTVNLKDSEGNIPGITDPAVPTDTTDAWTGSKVYFGGYDTAGDGTAEPILFRVLDSQTTDYSADNTTKTMLLDCDTVLKNMAFRKDIDAIDANVWSASELKTWMQGNAAGQFLNGFTALEQSAIAVSSKASPSATDGDGWSDLGWTGLSGDTVFALDAKEATNTSYGYSNDYSSAANRKKTGNWWLRSPYVDVNELVGCVENGCLDTYYIYTSLKKGASPALNLKLSSVLFTTASGDNGAGSVDKSSSFAMTEVSSSNTWNLTLLGGSGFAAALDKDEAAPQGTVTVNVKNLGVQADGSTAADGSYYSQISAMLLDGNGTVVAYGKIADSAATGDISFALPEGITAGDYTLKVFAEKVNSSATSNATDYASNMASFDFAVAVKNINLNVDGKIPGITDPVKPTTRADVWKGSKVYFGSYDTAGDGTSEPILFRVLDARTTDYSVDNTTKTMLLDCDTILKNMAFRTDYTSDMNKWSVSDLRTWMQGKALGQFLNCFTALEQSSIAVSNKTSVFAADGDGRSDLGWAGLSGDTVFALDAKEATNTSYGYSNDYTNVENRNKTGDWWLRSPSASYSNAVGRVYSSGSLSDCDRASVYGASPALNLNLSSVLFTTACGDNGAGSASKSSSFAMTEASSSNTWNLTLLGGSGFAAALAKKEVPRNENINVNVTTLGLQADGTFADGSYYSQLSAMLVDGDGTVVAYGKIADSATTGDVSFALPEGIALGDYTLKVFAEKVNSSVTSNATDYASNMASFDITVESAVKNINLNVDGKIPGITDPAVPTTTTDAWKGSKVYFGSYDTAGDGTAEPILFRVLDARTTDYSADGTTKTMLLDCDTILKTMRFGDNNTWSASDLRTWMQGNALGEFLNSFTALEQSAIAVSDKASASATDGDGSPYLRWTGLSGDTVFALDAKEATNISYGYSNIWSLVASRKKPGGNAIWWLRSPSIDDGLFTGNVIENGKIGVDFAAFDDNIGVSPALNLNLTSILFASASEADTSSKSSLLAEVGTDNISTNIWKLTLLDNTKTVKVTDARSAYKETVGGTTTVTVPYTYTGDDVSQISVMITNTDRTARDAEVLYYGALDTALDDNTKAGVGTFTLPSGLPAEYKVYLLAEDVNDGNYSDYASEPVEVTICDKGTLTLPDISKIYDGNEVADITTVNGYSTNNTIGTVTVEYSEKDADSWSTTAPTDAGEYTVRVSIAETVTHTAVSATKDFTISYLEAPEVPYNTTPTSPNEAGWYKETVTITPAAGYTISTKLNGDYTNSLMISASVKAYKIYLKNELGQMTDAIIVGDVNIDTAAPTISVTGNTGAYLTEDTVNITTTVNGTSDIAKVEVQKEGSADWTDITTTYMNGYKVTENGTYTFRVTSAAGLTDEAAITYDKIDSAKPVVNINSNGYTDGTWTNSDVNLKITNETSNLGTSIFEYSTDGGTTWLTYPSEGIVINSDTNGTTYSFRITSAAGAASDVKSITVKRDTAAPSDVTVSYVTDGFKEFLNTITFGLFFNDTVTVTISAADTGSSVKEISYKLGDGEVKTAAAEDGSIKFNVEPEFKGNISEVTVTDNAGNKSAEKAYEYFAVDKKAPTGLDVKAVEVTAAGSGVGTTQKDYISGTWTNADVTFTVSGAAATSGILKYQYSTDGGNTWQDMETTEKTEATAAEPFNVTKAELAVSTDCNGVSYIFRAVSNAGNESAKSSATVVKIDKTAPAVAVRGDVDSILPEDTVTITPTAGISGIAKVEVSKAGNTDWTDITATYTNGYKVTENGTYIFRVTNGAGVVSASDSITFDKIDSAKPEIELDADGYTDGTWTQDTVSITASNKTNNLGTTVLKYQINGGEWKSYTGTIVAGTDTKGDVYTFKAVSEAGLESEAKSITVKKDSVNPDGDITIKGNSVKKFINAVTFGLFFKENVEVTITGTDATSGVASIQYYRADKVLTEDDVNALADDKWTDYNGKITETAENSKKFIYYVKITDNAGLVTYLGSDGATFDTQKPVINGITDGAVYYTTQNFTVEDANFASVTINGVEMKTRTINLTLAGNVEKTYVVKVTDLAGNESVCTVTMKPVASIDDSIDDLETANVTSADKSDVELVQKLIESMDTTDASATEKAELENISGKCRKLLEKIAEVEAAKASESADKVENIKPDNVKPEDKKALEEALEDLKEILENNRNNLTEAEKKELQDKIDRIEDAIEVIEKVENTQAVIDKLPKAEDVTASDKEVIEAAQKAYEELTEYESSLVDSKKLNAALEALAKLSSKDEKPKTGDTSNLWMWFALAFASGTGILVVSRKRRQSNR